MNELSKVISLLIKKYPDHLLDLDTRYVTKDHAISILTEHPEEIITQVKSVLPANVEVSDYEYEEFVDEETHDKLGYGTVFIYLTLNDFKYSKFVQLINEAMASQDIPTLNSLAYFHSEYYHWWYLEHLTRNIT